MFSVNRLQQEIFRSASLICRCYAPSVCLRVWLSFAICRLPVPVAPNTYEPGLGPDSLMTSKPEMQKLLGMCRKTESVDADPRKKSKRDHAQGQ